MESITTTLSIGVLWLTAALLVMGYYVHMLIGLRNRVAKLESQLAERTSMPTTPTMLTDNELLIDLVLVLRSHGVSQERVRQLQQHLGKCQNDETCDGSVKEDVWNCAKTALEAAKALEQCIDRLAYIRH